MTLKQRIGKILDKRAAELIDVLRTENNVNIAIKKAVEIDAQSTSSLLQAFRECVPEKKEIEEKYTGLSTGYFSELDTKNIGFNAAIKIIEERVNE